MKTSKRIIRHRVKYRSNEFYKTLTYFLICYKTLQDLKNVDSLLSFIFINILCTI